MTDQESYQNGRYVILRELGRGGSGVVLCAHDIRLDRFVALKVLPPAADDTHAERLLREAKVTARLPHHNIVMILDTFIEDNRPCLVLEYVEGSNLAQFIRTTHSNPDFCNRLLHAAASALAVVHGDGSVHGDITPNNILIRANDFAVKLVDFGLTKNPTDRRLTKSGMFNGTRGYIAPEVYRTGRATAAADIWALGVVMQEAVDALPRPRPTSKILRSVIERMVQENLLKRPSAREIVSLMAQLVGGRPGEGNGSGPHPEASAPRDESPATEKYIPTRTASNKGGMTKEDLSAGGSLSATRPAEPDSEPVSAEEPDEILSATLLDKESESEAKPLGFSGSAPDARLPDEEAASSDNLSPEEGEPLVGVVLPDEASPAPEPAGSAEEEWFDGVVLPDYDPEPDVIGEPAADAKPEPSDEDTETPTVESADAETPKDKESAHEAVVVTPAPPGPVPFPRWVKALAAALVTCGLVALSLSLMVGRPIWEAHQYYWDGISRSGPWNYSELKVLKEQPLWGVAATLPNGAYGLMAGDYDSYEPLEFASDAHWVEARFRFTGNRGPVGFTYIRDNCDFPPKTDQDRPGLFLVTPVTDDKSQYPPSSAGGKWVDFKGTLYALVRASCGGTRGEELGLPPGRSTNQFDVDVTFSTPIRPDGQGDPASMKPVGLIMISKEGRVVVLQHG